MVGQVLRKPWKELIYIQGHPVDIKLDTGADVNILPERLIKEWPNMPLLETADCKIYTYTGQQIPVVGKCKFDCKTKYACRKVTFLIVNNSAVPILGLDECEKLNLVKRVERISDISVTLTGLLDEYKDVFKGNGHLSYMFDIKISEKAEPKISPARRLPRALLQPVREELFKMEEDGIIEKIEEPTVWAHPMVVVKKPSGKYRICIDPRELNKWVLREHYTLPAPENILAEIPKAKFYSVLDAKSAFWQVPLSENASKYLVMSTPFGRYRFLRLPFGISSAPDIFQKIMHKIFCDIPNVVCYIDDLLKWGKSMIPADTLSRHFLPQEQMEDKELDLCTQTFVLNVEIKDQRLTRLQEDTLNDKECCLLKQYILTGWSLHKKNLPSNLKPYWEFKEELHEWQNLICRGNKLLIPKTQRSDMLKILHASHQGINNTIALAKRSIYWPGMNKEIEELINNCSICQQTSRANPKEPMLPHQVPDYPWQKVGIDIFQLESSKYLLIVDYFSKYPEIYQLQDMTTDTIIRRLKRTFSNFGIPETLVSDNGPPFFSKEFQNFTRTWNIVHVTSSPYHAQSNGMVERTVQTLKKLIKRCGEESTDPYLALLNLRNTPHNNLPSPAQILMSRNLRSIIPSKTSQFVPSMINNEAIQKQLVDNQVKMKNYYDRHTRPADPLSIKDRVWFRKDKRWIPGQLKNQANEPRSFYVKDQEGNEYRRNSIHIREDKRSDTTHTDWEKPLELNQEQTDLQDLEESPSRPTSSGQLSSPGSPENVTTTGPPGSCTNGSPGNLITTRSGRDDLDIYFKEKSSLAKKLNLGTPLLLEALTDGMPNYLKKYLIAARVKETSDWIKIATQLKYSTNQEKQEPQCKYNSDNQQPSTSNDNRQNFQTRSYYPARSRFNPNSSPSLQPQPPPRSSPRSITAHHQEASSRTINLPPYPCKICSSHQLPNQYHFHRDCPLNKHEKELPTNTHSEPLNPGRTLCLPCVLDTASSISIMPLKYLNHIHYKILDNSPNERIGQVEGFSYPLYKILVRLTLGKITKYQEFFVCNSSIEYLILGLPTFYLFKLQIDFSKNLLFQNYKFLYSFNPKTDNQKSYATTLCIPDPYYVKNSSLLNINPLCNYNSFDIPNTNVKLIDPNSKPIIDFNSFHSMRQPDSITNYNSYLDFSKVNINPNFSDQTISDILHKYKNVFSKHNFDIGHIKTNPICISLLDNISIAQKPYRTSFYNNAEIQKQITELLKYDIIRPSSSPYSSPALLVIKKSDAPNHPTRLCIEYRKLNQKTVPEHTPIPLIEQIIDRLSQSKIYTILDVKNAYWHIPIDEKDRHKTSFVTQLGCYEWNRLPYGLKNAPSQFERIMKSVFTKHNIHYALNYFDDIIIHSKPYEEHIKHLDDILGIFEQEDIKLNLNKCKFLQKEIQFLGYTINSGKYTPNNTNIEAILKLNRPYNIKTLQRFLGTINIYNKFIPHYAQIRAPLNELLLKNAPWLWSVKHEQAFQTLKNSLISQPVLYIYDPSKPCHLFTDASSLGVAGVLKQPDEQGILHPIDRNNVKHLLTSSHHPETNAKVERLNSTIINRLRCEYNANLKIPWTKYIPKITESYNETAHTTTGFTPKFLYYGIQPQHIEHDTETHIPIEKARKLAIERTIKSHEHSKQLYDIKHPEPIFKEGDQNCRYNSQAAPPDGDRLKLAAPPLLTLGHRVSHSMMQQKTLSLGIAASTT
ncbi:K02A2.6-like, partial [Cordylochernes scorpioides]